MGKIEEPPAVPRREEISVDPNVRPFVMDILMSKALVQRMVEDPALRDRCRALVQHMAEDVKKSA